MELNELNQNEKKDSFGVFLVEANQDNALRIQKIVTEIGHRVIGLCHSASDVLNLAKESIPDIILMGVGSETSLGSLSKMFESRYELRVPVIFLMSNFDQDFIDEFKRNDSFDYLLSPFEAQRLDLAIEIAIYKFRMKEALRKSDSNLSSG